MATDPQAVAAVQAALEALAEHHPTRGMAVTSGVTCACGYWTGSERQPPRCTGDDGLDYHRAAAVVERLAPTIAARALEDAADKWQDHEFVEVAWLRASADSIRNQPKETP